jgi:hypothetical protein
VFSADRARETERALKIKALSFRDGSHARSICSRFCDLYPVASGAAARSLFELLAHRAHRPRGAPPRTARAEVLIGRAEQPSSSNRAHLDGSITTHRGAITAHRGGITAHALTTISLDLSFRRLAAARRIHAAPSARERAGLSGLAVEVTCQRGRVALSRRCVAARRRALSLTEAWRIASERHALPIESSARFPALGAASTRS